MLLLQLQYGQHDETKHKCEIVAILSMTEVEIDETIEIVSSTYSSIKTYQCDFQMPMHFHELDH